MRKIRLADHLTDEELVERMNMSEGKEQFRRWQAIYLIQTQEVSEDYAYDLLHRHRWKKVTRSQFLCNKIKDANLSFARGLM